MNKEEIIKLINGGISFTHVAKYYNCSRTKLRNYIKNNFSEKEYDELYTMVHITREKSRASKHKTSISKIFCSVYFKNIGIENCSEEQLKYLEFVIQYIQENNIQLNKITKFLSRQITYYENSDDYYQGFTRYMSGKVWYAYEKDWWILCYGKSVGEIKYAAHMNNFDIFSNGKKSKEEIDIIKYKISKSVREYNSNIEDELYFKRNSPMCKEFYIYRQGMDILDAIESAKKFCNVGSEIGMENIRNLPRSKIGTTIDYWLQQTNGDLKLAQHLLKLRQQTFSYKICIEKYGIENGYKIWKARQDLWLNTLRERGFLLKEVTDKHKYLQYKKIVNKITRKQKIHELENFDLRGSDPNTSYHLDHKFSIRMGYEHQIDPNIIGNIVNLIFIPYRDNCGKRENCSITIEELLEDYNLWVKIHGKPKLYK